MSISAMHKADNKARKAAGKAERTFAQYKADQERMAKARAARGSKTAATPRKRASKAVQAQVELVTVRDQIAALKAQIAALEAPEVEETPQAQDVERISHRVDCFGVNKAGIVTLAVDSADVRKAEKALSGLYCLRGESYNSSGRGERTRLQIQQGQVQKVVTALRKAGLTPAGARGWKRASVTL